MKKTSNGTRGLGRGIRGIGCASRVQTRLVCTCSVPQIFTDVLECLYVGVTATLGGVLFTRPCWGAPHRTTVLDELLRYSAAAGTGAQERTGRLYVGPQDSGRLHPVVRGEREGRVSSTRRSGASKPTELSAGKTRRRRRRRTAHAPHGRGRPVRGAEPRGDVVARRAPPARVPGGQERGGVRRAPGPGDRAHDRRDRRRRRAVARVLEEDGPRHGVQGAGRVGASVQRSQCTRCKNILVRLRGFCGSFGGRGGAVAGSGRLRVRST